MNVRRYVAADMREALRLVQEDLGPDAVVLENRRVAGGIELVATLDHEQAVREHEERLRERQRQVDAHRRSDHEELLLPRWMREDQETDFGQNGIEDEDSRAEQDFVKNSRREPVSERFVEAVITRPQGSVRDQQLAGLSQHLQSQRKPAQDHNDVQALRAEIELLRAQLRDLKKSPAHPGSVQPVGSLDRLRHRLDRIGLSEDLSAQLIEGIGLVVGVEGMQQDEKLWQATLGRLAKMIRIDQEQELVDRQGLVVLLGPTGAGKTTTLAKLAARHVIKHGPQGLALLSSDSYRVGSYEQLQKIAKALGVSSALVEPGQKLDQVIAALGSRRLILMDTAGFSRQAAEQLAQQRLLAESRYRLMGQLVLPANLHGAVLQRTFEDFSSFNLSGAIISKIDEATSLGESLSVLVGSSLPLSYVTHGQRIPEDIALPRAAQLVSQAVAMARQHGRVAQRVVTKQAGRLANSSHN